MSLTGIFSPIDISMNMGKWSLPNLSGITFHVQLPAREEEIRDKSRHDVLWRCFVAMFCGEGLVCLQVIFKIDFH